MVAASTDRTTVVTRFESRHLEALTDFYREMWDPGATPEAVGRARAVEAERNLAEPGADIPTYLFLQGQRVLGHLSTIPVRLREGGRDRPAYWLIGFMVRPEHRNGPIGFLLLREAVRELEVLLSLTVQQTTVRLMTALGFRELGTLPNYVRPLRPGRVLAKVDLDALGLAGLPATVRLAFRAAQLPVVSALVGLAAGAGLGLWTGLNGQPRGVVPARDDVDVLGAPADVLWHGCRDRLGHVAGRDSAYLRWRYGGAPDGAYRSMGVFREGVSCGVAVIRAPRSDGDPRLRGIRVATLSDLLYDPSDVDTGLALVAGAEQAARSLEADVLMASVSHRGHRLLLRRRGFLRLGGNLRFLVRDATGVLPGPGTLCDWWLLRGDMNADMVF